MREVLQKAKPLIITAIQALTDIDDTGRLLSKANVLLTGIETAARLIESRLQ